MKHTFGITLLLFVVLVVDANVPAGRASAQFVQQGTKLVGTGAVGAASQGQSVFISADGNTAIMGGPSDNGSAGAAWVFTRSGGVWTQQGNKLLGTGAVGAASQGWSVSISADGNTAIAGGLSDNSNAGAAWVYSNAVVDVPSNGEMPKVFVLAQNYPNPFNPTTTFAFDIPYSSFVILKVYNVLGQEVATVVDETLPAGRYTQTFNAQGLGSGVYFYRLQAGSFSEVKKLMLVK